jgi:hypothetical protein
VWENKTCKKPKPGEGEGWILKHNVYFFWGSCVGINRKRESTKSTPPPNLLVAKKETATETDGCLFVPDRCVCVCVPPPPHLLVAKKETATWNWWRPLCAGSVCLCMSPVWGKSQFGVWSAVNHSDKSSKHSAAQLSVQKHTTATGGCPTNLTICGPWSVSNLTRVDICLSGALCVKSDKFECSKNICSSFLRNYF